jgi:hypothetical protein
MSSSRARRVRSDTLQPAPSSSLLASPASTRPPLRTTSAVTAERAGAAGDACRPPLRPPSLPLPPSRSFFLPASHTSLGWAEAERMREVPGLSHFRMRAGTRSSCAAESCRAHSLLCMSHFSYLRYASCLIAGFVLSLRLSLIHLSSSSSSAEREINLLFHKYNVIVWYLQQWQRAAGARMGLPRWGDVQHHREMFMDKFNFVTLIAPHQLTAPVFRLRALGAV